MKTMSETIKTIPDWANFWSTRAHAVFLQELEDALTARDMAPQLDNDTGIATLTDPESKQERTFAMRGIALICAEAGGTTAFRATIDQQLDRLLVGYDDNAAAGDLDGDWERARNAIKVRLYPIEEVIENDDILLYRAIGGALAAVLVYDMPESIFSVEPDVAESWPVSMDELWSIALENVRTEDPAPTVERLNIGDTEAVIAYGDSFFVTSRLLLLGDIMDPDDFPHGAIVSMPHRHALIFHPITAQDTAVNALNEMILVTDEMFSEGQGALSTDLFWWLPERIERIPVQIDDDAGELIIDPSEDFVQLINSLPESSALPDPEGEE